MKWQKQQQIHFDEFELLPALQVPIRLMIIIQSYRQSFKGDGLFLPRVLQQLLRLFRYNNLWRKRLHAYEHFLASNVQLKSSSSSSYLRPSLASSGSNASNSQEPAQRTHTHTESERERDGKRSMCMNWYSKTQGQERDDQKSWNQSMFESMEGWSTDNY